MGRFVGRRPSMIGFAEMPVALRAGSNAKSDPPAGRTSPRNLTTLCVSSSYNKLVNQFSSAVSPHEEGTPHQSWRLYSLPQVTMCEAADLGPSAANAGPFLLMPGASGTL